MFLHPQLGNALAVPSVALVLACSLAACSGGGGARATPAKVGSPVVVSGSGIYLGVYLGAADGVPPPPSELATFEAQIGRTLALTQHYYGFYDSFPGTSEAADAAAGRIPIESWNCGPSNAAVAAGTQDGAIRRRADAVKAYGRRIFIRYMWEMNLPATPTYRESCYSSSTDSPNGIFSPLQFVAAWDRIRAIFTQEGVSNVVWLWNPSGSSDPSNYYPGPNEVDWVGADKYDDASLPFAETYSQAYGFLLPFDKPIMIAETGAAAAIQPEFFAAAAPTLMTQYPLIKGYVYFDSAGFTNNWAFSPAGLQAFATMAHDPYFGAKP